MLLKNKRVIILVLVIFCILLIPFIAMQITNEVSWELSDFLMAGVLLFSAGFICEIVLRKIQKPEYRIFLIVCILVLLVLIWIELAVGIFGSPFAGT